MNTLQDQSLGTLVVEHPGWVPVFESLGLDFCCGGQQTLRDALDKRGLDPSTVLTMLSALPATSVPEVAAARMDTSKLINHIVAVHHAFVRRELPLLTSLTQKVAKAHGTERPFTAQLVLVWERLSETLAKHLDDEESDLFPALHLAAAENRVLNAGEFFVYFRDHDDVADMLGNLRDLTDGFVKPDWACPTYCLLLEGLVAFERGIHRHVHLENNVLFPRLGARP